MPEVVVNALIQAGILGPIVAACGIHILRLQRDLHAAHEKRVTDAQNTLDRVLALVDQQHERDAALITGLTALQQAVRDLQPRGRG